MLEYLRMLKKKKGTDKEIIVNEEGLETRVAVLEEGKLEGFFVERESEDRIVGSIFKGKIQNVEDSLQAAFVDIGMKKNAFIHYWDMIPEDAARLEKEEGVSRGRGTRKKKYAAGEMAKKFPVGSEIVVQVTKGAIGTKGPRVNANLSIPGRYLVMMPGSRLKGVSKKIDDAKERDRLKKVLARLPAPSDLGLIVRTAGSGARQISFARDTRALVNIWAEIEKGIAELPAPCRLYQEPDLVERVVRDSLTEDVERIVIDDREEFNRVKELVARISRRGRNRIKLYDGNAPIFEHFDVQRQLESAFQRKVWLKSGGYLVFDETEAMVAIDVNTGRHKGGKTQEEAIVEVNIEAAEEVARQLRLRNVGGLVVIDFIDMKSRRHQNNVYRTLKEAVRRDKARTNVLPVSDLGLIEMTRQRAEESIRSANFVDCPYCRGRGVVKSALSMSVDIQRRLAQLMRAGKRGDVPSLRITVNPSVLERLRSEDEDMLVELEEKFGMHMAFVADPNIHIEQFRIVRTEDDVELYPAGSSGE